MVHFTHSIPASRHPKQADVKERLVGGHRRTPEDFPNRVRGLAVSLLKEADPFYARQDSHEKFQSP